MKKLILAALAAATFALPFTQSTPAEAGSAQAEATRLPIAEVTTFARSVEEDLAKRGAHVAIVARVGRDPADLPSGINFTHVGFWVLSDIRQPDGTTTRGYRVWNLYQRAGDPGISDLVQDGPADFFAGAQRLRAGVIVPRPELQARLLRILTSETYSDLHNPQYSVLANPDNNRYQNCTEHMLNVLMAALYDTDDMGRIKSNTAAHFEAQPVRLSPMKRALGPVFVSGVETDDHGGAALKTTTFTSIARFMDRYDLQDRTYTLRHVTNG